MKLTELQCLLKVVSAEDNLFPKNFPAEFEKAPRAIHAFEGDMNGAFALFEHHFTGWVWSMQGGEHHSSACIHNGEQQTMKNRITTFGAHETPSRAFLIAMINAMIEIEKKGTQRRD